MNRQGRASSFPALIGALLRMSLLLACLTSPASGQQILFACTGTGGETPSSLYSIDPATGAGTLIGPMGINGCGGLAFDPATRTLFAVGTEPGSSMVSLWQVDISTGTATLIGATGVEEIIPKPATARIADISLRPSDGVLFAFLQPEPILVTLDVDNGAATLVGESAIEGMNGNGIAFDATDSLFHTDDVSLTILDDASGVPTPVAEHTFPSVKCGDIPRINALDFNLDGTMFGSMNCGSGMNASPIYLVTINPADGVVTEIGTTIDGLDGIAFGPQPAPGDANCDGRIGAADLTALLSLIPDNRLACGADVNEDGEVDSADIESLIALIFMQ